MPTNFIKRSSALAGPAGYQNANSVRVDSDTDTLAFGTGASGVTEKIVADTTSVQTLTNKTIVGAIVTSAPILAGATLTVTAALHAGKTILLDQVAGTVNTLPAATGTGNKFRFVGKVALTSVSNIWLSAPATDLMSGGVTINNTGDTTAATSDFYPAVPATSNKVTGTLLAGGGSIGDWIEFQDIGAALWAVTGFWVNGADPANPFSAA